MAYQIISLNNTGNAIDATVQYFFTDGSDKTITVPIFQPQTVEDIITGIENREISEQTVLDFTSSNDALIQELQPNTRIIRSNSVMEQLGIKQIELTLLERKGKLQVS